MKIIKKKSLIEEVVNAKDIAGEYMSDVYDDGAIDLTGTESPDDLVKILAAGAAANGQQAVDTTKLKKDSKTLQQWIDLILDPKVNANAKIAVDDTEIGKELQTSVKECFRAMRRGTWEDIDGKYPNILIVGASGGAKTAIVSSFCKAYNIKLVLINVSTATPEFFSGIGYPINIKGENGAPDETVLGSVTSKTWGDLQKEQQPFIVFCDEINRGTHDVQNPLLELINNHRLVAGDKTFYFPNMLFTVGALNPATEGQFQGTNPLDRAMTNRFPVTIQQKLAVEPFKKHILAVLDTELSNPYNTKEDTKEFQSKKNLMTTLLSDTNFSFDDEEDEKIMQMKGYEGIKSLNYRTLSSVLERCDGTKKGFIEACRKAPFAPDTLKMIENCLKNYKDVNNTVNQNVFNNTTAASAAGSTAGAGAGSSIRATISKIRANLLA